MKNCGLPDGYEDQCCLNRSGECTLDTADYEDIDRAAEMHGCGFIGVNDRYLLWKHGVPYRDFICGNCQHYKGGTHGECTNDQVRPHTKGIIKNGEGVYVDSKEYYSGAHACDKFIKKQEVKEVEVKSSIQNINIEKLHPHPDNPRQDLGDLTELAESIKTKGILQNLTVVPMDQYKPDCYKEYRVVIGHRRLAAAKLAGLTEVPCAIAEMTPQEQIATMLLENIQRADLTFYEQAQGFQMMLNLGDTVNDIAEQTGFSSTTVRRRIKLLELDQDKFKKSISRGATLMDYTELEKIEDRKLRNKVLDTIGTPNFRYELQRAIDKERADKVKHVIIELLSSFASKTDKTEGLQYVKAYYSSQFDEKDFQKPEDAGEVKYFYKLQDWGGIDLYKEGAQTTSADAEARAEKEKIRQNLIAALTEVSNRAYKLRHDYVFNISNNQAKKLMPFICKYAVKYLVDCYASFELDTVVTVLGIPINDEDELEYKDIAERANAQAERCLLALIFNSADSKSNNYFDWNGRFRANKNLNDIYEFIEELGYEVSDEENRMRLGIHELFAEQEDDEDE